MPSRRIKRRWIRILEACQEHRLDEIYQRDPRFRADLEREAALDAKHFGAGLLTPAMLRNFKASIGLPVAAGGEPVVIVPGCLSTSLDDVEPPARQIWLNPPNLAGPGICDLKLAPYDGSEQDAQPGVRIEPAGLFRCLFFMLDAHLKRNGFAPRHFPFDWRKSVDHESSAIRLMNLILALHNSSNRNVHIVAHSLGGLLARRAVQLLCDQQGPTAKQIVGRLVLLGAAVSGTFAAALGVAASLSQLPFLGSFLSPSRYTQQTTRTWTTLYQLLPWNPCLLPSLQTNDVRKASFWRCVIDRDRLSLAFPAGGAPWASQINTQCFHDRTAVILGYHPLCKTASGVSWSGKTLMATYSDDLVGDGFMLHACSTLPDTKAYLACGVDHIRLPMDPGVIRAVTNVLKGNARVGLPRYRPDAVPCPELKSATSPPKGSPRPRGRT